MANRYILNPDGTISKYDGNVLEDPVNLNKKDEEGVNLPLAKALNTEVQSNFGLDVENINPFVLDEEDEDQVKNAITATTEIDSSFGFKTTGDDFIEQRQYVNFTSIDTKKGVKPKPYATEPEILAGVRDLTDLTGSSEIFLLMFTYFVQSGIRLALAEVIVVLNNLANISDGYHNVSEKYQLRLGRYDFTEFDGFTKYFLNVLNYPHSKSTTLERLAAFFVGFNEWLAPDSLINFNGLVKEFSKYENVIDLGTSLFDQDSNRKTTNTLNFVLMGVVTAAAETALSVVTNSQVVEKRARLLFRKFQREEYWHKNVLYSAKEEDKVYNFITDLNYYYFRFYIERVHIGLRILKKYVFDETYLNLRQNDVQFNRVSGQRSSKYIDYQIGFLNTGIKADVGGVGLEDLVANFDKIEKAKTKQEIAKALAKVLAPLPVSIPDVPQTDLVYNWKQRDSDRFIKDKNNEFIKKPGSSTRVRALPQLLTMHESLYKALFANTQGTEQPKLDIHKSISQNFYDLKGEQKRIPEAVVKFIENELEAEYMPFYFHDLRTNEILSFHAFIDSITDSFNPEYNSASGFGRIEDVRSYIKTTRNVNLGFTIASTSELDHDLMWYQINKLVAMVYPQWSDAFSVEKEPTPGSSDDFKYPFTQVPTASPLIRLRVGDVIKSNYSRTNLSRLHGIGEREIDKKQTSVLNGNNELSDKPFLLPGLYKQAVDSAGFGIGLAGKIEMDPKSFRLDHETEIEAIDEANANDKFVTVTINNPFFKKIEIDLANPTKIPSPKTKQIKLQVDATKIIHTHKLKTFGGNNEVKSSANAIMRPFSPAGASESKNNNPITKAYESGMSRGLAGFITQLDVNYNEVNWDVGRIGSKAPMLVKVSINFAPIHDIPPGLDHNGMLRAPVYNVGRLNNQLFGDPHDDLYTGEGRDKALEKYNRLKGLDT